MLRTALLCWVLVASTTAADACFGGQGTIEYGFARARTVFAARVVRTEEAQMLLGREIRTIVEATFRVSEVFKGAPPQEQKVRSLVYGPTNCTIPLLVGWDYVFFLSSDDDRNFVYTPGGHAYPLNSGFCQRF
jgi:hypothetical protein